MAGMKPKILDDSYVASHLEMSDAVACMNEAFYLKAAGKLAAPARFGPDLDVGQLMFTAGAARGGNSPVGFRVYDIKQLGSANRGELTAVFSGEDGSLRGAVVGPLLGAYRTGAIGGAAIDNLSRNDASVLGVVGSGVQARTQVMAAVTVRQFKSIRIYSRTKENLTRFCVEMSSKVDAPIVAAESARAAVEGADVVVCATTSMTPVVEAEWLKPGVHVSTIGPKFKSGYEVDIDVVERAAVIATDAPAQIEASGDAFFLAGMSHYDWIADLSDIAAGTANGRQSESDITLFYSMGLAGTEVMLADFLIDQSAST
jgi:ornithine cyclodeaminase/alanine dehydrogenase-like protein (mu-crystallin family)